MQRRGRDSSAMRDILFGSQQNDLPAITQNQRPQSKPPPPKNNISTVQIIQEPVQSESDAIEKMQFLGAQIESKLKQIDGILGKQSNAVIETIATLKEQPADKRSVLAKAGLQQIPKRPPLKKQTTDDVKKQLREENAKNFLKSAARHSMQQVEQSQPQGKLPRALSAVKTSEVKSPVKDEVSNRNIQSATKPVQPTISQDPKRQQSQRSVPNTKLSVQQSKNLNKDLDVCEDMSIGVQNEIDEEQSSDLKRMIQQLQKENGDFNERCRHLDLQLKQKQAEISKLKKQIEPKQETVKPMPHQEPVYTDQSKYSTFRWQVIYSQNVHLMSENKYLRAIQQSYRKVVRETELILNQLDGGKDLLARLKSIQKNEGKSYNQKEADNEVLNEDQVAQVELVNAEIKLAAFMEQIQTLQSQLQSGSIESTTLLRTMQQSRETAVQLLRLSCSTDHNQKVARPTDVVDFLVSEIDIQDVTKLCQDLEKVQKGERAQKCQQIKEKMLQERYELMMATKQVDLLRVQYSKIFQMVSEAKNWMKDKLTDLPKLIEVLTDVTQCLDLSSDEVRLAQLNTILTSNQTEIHKALKQLARLVKSPFSVKDQDLQKQFAEYVAALKQRILII